MDICALGSRNGSREWQLGLGVISTAGSRIFARRYTIDLLLEISHLLAEVPDFLLELFNGVSVEVCAVQRKCSARRIYAHIFA